jgi:hypothetical protein
LSTRQYARIVDSWVEEIGLDPAAYGTHSIRRTKPSLIYRRTKNLRAVLHSAFMPQSCGLTSYPSGDFAKLQAICAGRSSRTRRGPRKFRSIALSRNSSPFRARDAGSGATTTVGRCPCRLPPCRQMITATQARVSDGRAPSCCMSEYRFATPQCSMIFPSCTRMASTASKWILRPVGATPRNVPWCVP